MLEDLALYSSLEGLEFLRAVPEQQLPLGSVARPSQAA